MRDDLTRRRIIVLASAAITSGLVGCLGARDESNNDGLTGSEEGDQQSGGGSDETEEDGGSKEAELPAQPSMEAESVEPDDANTTLSIRWNGTVFDAVTFPDEKRYWESGDDEHYLILQLAIENTGDNPADFVPGELQITVDGTGAEWTVLVEREPP